MPLLPFRGALDWPVDGRVVGRFADPNRLGGSAARNGIDIGAAAGAPAHAVHGGVASFAGVFTGFGTLVILDHGANSYSLYGYLASTPLMRGDRVDAGANSAGSAAHPAGRPRSISNYVSTAVRSIPYNGCGRIRAPGGAFQECRMTSRTRLWVLAISTPVIVFAIIGGYLGQAHGAKDDTYQHLRVFEDVVVAGARTTTSRRSTCKQAMRGAMRGLTDGLDPDSAFLTPELVKAFESNAAAGPADVGLELTRQYYLRVVSSARDGSPAAKAGLRTGDYIRAIDGRATRDMSAFEGDRAAAGRAPAARSRCSSSAATPPTRTRSP